VSGATVLQPAPTSPAGNGGALRLPVVPDALRTNFSVLIPAFDEVDNIPALFAELRAMFHRHGLGGEIILVDDGSRDGTYEAALRESA
jgi:hypothetical protein